ncbi:MAG: diguanylate cyclase [Oscillospiraceae bacterium]|nr:diguanylate cyclase [Oscillospiraceae bacterium]MDY6207906.1 diguanylate cyclase [Oscillospiraceae bacterium]
MSFISNDKKKSLRNKILFSSIAVLLLLAVVLGTVSVYVVDKLSSTNSNKVMTQLCEKEAYRFDNKLNLVKHSVNIINEYANELQYLNGITDVYSDEYEQRIKDFSIAVANQTSGALAVYFRYSPEVTGSGTDGFFWTRQSNSDEFAETEITDILSYNSSDVGHVGWFYIPKETGKPLWMTPYYNQNLDVFMISYIIPMYQDNGEFIGVVGMDIDFATILSETKDIDIYESASVAFVDLKERISYSSDNNGAVESSKLSNALYNHISTINKFSELLEIGNSDGSTSVICCEKLSNGMMLYVNVPKSEIDSNRNFLMMLCIIITVMIFIVSIIFISKRTSQIVYPLEKLTEITKHYANGDWSGQYISNTDDEIENLSESISQMAKNTQKYIEKLNALALTDALTGIGNKTSYLEMTKNIQNNKHDNFNEYAVVALDLNLLKKTNDTYGHECGDILLREASRYICQIFEHSPVYRTGGDEFVVILYSDDYRRREELLSRFEKGLNYPIEGIPSTNLSIAFGMAEHSSDNPDYESVFELADERMYRKKAEMKNLRQK